MWYKFQFALDFCSQYTHFGMKSVYSDDSVAIFNHSLPMGDENDRFPLIAQNIVEQLPLGIGIERTGCLIQQDDAAGPKQCAGNGNALRLSFRQAPTLLGKLGIEPIGQLADEIGASQPKGFVHLCVRCIGSPNAQVVAQRATEQGVALGHIDEVAAVERGEGRTVN